MRKILLINGPNLNMLGKREPSYYGIQTLKDITASMQQFFKQHKNRIELCHIQSNHEGVLVDFIHSHHDSDFIIINPAAYTHTSVAIRDSLLSVKIPFIEIHLSNVYARENFRHNSFLSDIAYGIITGLGTQSYMLAAHAALTYLQENHI